MPNHCAKPASRKARDRLVARNPAPHTRCGAISDTFLIAQSLLS